MTLFNPTTLSQLDEDLAMLKTHAANTAEALNYTSAVATNGHAWLWQLPTDRLLAVLNADQAFTAALFTSNHQLGTVLNAQLDSSGLAQFVNRIPVAYGRADITYDETAGAWVQVAQEESQTPSEE